LLDAAPVEQITALLSDAGLPVALPELDVERCLAVMGTDKKVQAGKLRFVLPTRLGAAAVFTDIPADQVQSAMASLRV